MTEFLGGQKPINQQQATPQRKTVSLTDILKQQASAVSEQFTGGLGTAVEGTKGLFTTPDVSPTPGMGLGAQALEVGAKTLQAGVQGAKNLGDMVGGLGAAVFSPLAPLNKLGEKAGEKIGLAVPTGAAQAFEKTLRENPSIGQNAETILSLSNLAVPDASVKGARAINKGKGALSEKMASVKEGAKDFVPSLDVTPEIIAAERKAKIQSGFEEQNMRLKTADKSFNENTISRKGSDGKVTKITPIDTFSEYNIAPTIEKGTIQMGDWKTGVGELGKMREVVSTLDNQLDTDLVNTGQKHNIEDFRQYTIDKATQSPALRQAGTVESTIAKIDAKFKDWQNSYGTELDIAEMNNIRKMMNKDWSPETKDASSLIGDSARDIIYDALPEGKAKANLQKQGELLAAKKYAEKLNGTKVTGGRLGNMAMRGTGAILGSTVQNMPVLGPLFGAMGGEYLARALQQSQFKSAWTELRGALLDLQSKSTEQTQSANTIPNKAVMEPSIPKKKVETSELSTPDLASQAKGKTLEEFMKGQEKNMVYHGSTVPIKSFNNKSGVFFTDDMMNADGYGMGENVYEGYLSLKNPLTIDAKGRRYDDLKTPYGKSTREIVANVDSKKYDGVIFKNIKDSFSDAEASDQVAGTISYAFRPKDAFLNESQLTDIWKKANEQ